MPHADTLFAKCLQVHAPATFARHLLIRRMYMAARKHVCQAWSPSVWNKVTPLVRHLHEHLACSLAPRSRAVLCDKAELKAHRGAVWKGETKHIMYVCAGLGTCRDRSCPSEFLGFDRSQIMISRPDHSSFCAGLKVRRMCPLAKYDACHNLAQNQTVRARECPSQSLPPARMQRRARKACSYWSGSGASFASTHTPNP